MNTLISNNKVCCFGEILWDVLPDGPQPGGAPLNVAYHLTKLKVNADLISRVGNDMEGEELANLMYKWELKTDFLQNDPVHDTGKVMARINDDNEVSYEIMFPVAWDFITINDATETIVKEAGYFVFGSLASRNNISRKTLFQLLDQAKIKVFDINLRPPHDESRLLEELLDRTDILKVNKSELEIISEQFGAGDKIEEEQINSIKNKYKIKEIVVTKGAHGASYYNDEGSWHADGVKVEVCDTIGSGDAFLAAFIAHHLRKEPPEIILKKAVAMGAFIAGKKGGCPTYQLSEYLDFMA